MLVPFRIKGIQNSLVIKKAYNLLVGWKMENFERKKSAGTNSQSLYVVLLFTSQLFGRVIYIEWLYRFEVNKSVSY